jgi:hypothetical protein
VSAWAPIVARIVDRMQTVPNVGLVHDSIRLAMSEDDFFSWARVDVGGEERIRAWMITVEEVQTSWATHDGLVDWDRRVTIRGHFQLEDGADSENGAMAIAEAVCAVLDSDIAATKLSGSVRFGGPCRITRNEPRLLSFVLCHYIEIELPIQTTEQR